MAKGSGFLKVVGIIMIVFGAIGIIISLLALLGSLAIGAVAVAVGVSPAMLIITCLVSLASAVALLICGIIGVKDHADPSKAQTCMTWAIIVIVLTLLGNVILPIITSQGISWLGALTGMILPGLFIYGAMLNKQS